MTDTEVVLRQDVLVTDPESELSVAVAVAHRKVDMLCAPQVGWTIVIGSKTDQPQVEKVTYVVRSGAIHATLSPVLVSDPDGAQSAIADLQERGYEIKRLPQWEAVVG